MAPPARNLFVRTLTWDVSDIDPTETGLGAMLHEERECDIVIVALQGAPLNKKRDVDDWKATISGATSKTKYEVLAVGQRRDLLTLVLVARKHKPFFRIEAIETVNTSILNDPETGGASAIHFVVHETKFTVVNAILKQVDGCLQL